MSSIRVRATLLVTVVIALVLVGGSYALMKSFRHSVVADQDVVAQSRIQQLSAQVRSGSLPDQLTDLGDDIAAQVVDSSGQVLAATAGLRGQGPIATTRPHGTELTVQTMRGVPDDSGHENYRMWSVAVRTPGGRVAIYLGTSLESASETTGTLQRSLVVGIPLVVAVLAVATWFVVGRALRPLRRLQRDVSTISERDLDVRVSVPQADEVKSLAHAMNAMLERIDQGTQRQRDFVADASHELQSPLTAMRIQLEVALAHSGQEDWSGTALEVLSDVSRMDRLVSDLLFLARADADELDEPNALVDLDAIVSEAIARARRAAPVDIDSTDVSPTPVRGARDDLARLVRNLIDNAVSYATSRVRVSATAVGDTAVLAVDDDGPGIPSSAREVVFDRFTRLEHARDLRQGGTGLGLAIALEVASRHGGSIRIDRSEDLGGARFVVRLPLDTGANARPDHAGHRSTTSA
jgi:signal transduction histidine kinase